MPLKRIAEKFSLINCPGYLNSSDQHWQTRWEQRVSQIVRLKQKSWDEPQLSDWLIELESKVSMAPNPVILLAHSLSVALINQWVKTNSDHLERIKGVLLVAPADVDSPAHTPKPCHNFAPMPLDALPFKSIVVTSDNDPYVDLARAELFAKAWGSEFINIGSFGHINAESGLGDWLQGQQLILQLIE